MDLKQKLVRLFGSLRARVSSFLFRAPHLYDLPQPCPQRLLGPWEIGWALDLHSHFIGETWQRSETGRLLCRYKYRGRIDLADKLADRLVALIEKHSELNAVDGLLVIPPTTPRLYDCVYLLGQVLARRLGVPLLSGGLQRIRTTDRQKDMRTRTQKRANVAGAFAVRGDVRGKSLLVLDDLYDSGETLREVTRVLKRAGVRSVKVLTLTRTIHTHP